MSRRRRRCWWGAEIKLANGDPAGSCAVRCPRWPGLGRSCGAGCLSRRSEAGRGGRVGERPDTAGRGGVRCSFVRRLRRGWKGGLGDPRPLSVRRREARSLPGGGSRRAVRSWRPALSRRPARCGRAPAVTARVVPALGGASVPPPPAPSCERAALGQLCLFAGVGIGSGLAYLGWPVDVAVPHTGRVGP